MKKRITVKVSPMGVPSVETEGYVGEECVSATAGIEKALAGSGGVSRDFKEEWAGSNSAAIEQHQNSW